MLLAFERTGRGGDPVASLYLAEAEWDAEADGGEAWDEWLERWEGDNGPARSVSREPCGEGPFTRRWEARNGSCLTVVLLAPRPDGLAVMLSLDAARPGRRPKAVGRWEEELHRIARAATIRPGKTESWEVRLWSGLAAGLSYLLARPYRVSLGGATQKPTGLLRHAPPLKPIWRQAS